MMKRTFDALGWIPHEHQQLAWQALERSKSIVLRAPTGSGKTEAVFLPFTALAGSILPSSLLYALPLRSLANQVVDRMQRHAGKLGKQNWRIRLQHGEAPESVLFAADVVVCTIDQLVTSYACTPLTLPLRHGNIPAGAVMSSFIIFDEVHLFDPERALQSMRLICERLKRLGLPFAILSATLPDSVLGFCQREFECELVDAQCETVQRSVQVEFQESELDSEQVIKAMQDGYHRILVVVNTVERAIRLFEQICQDARRNGYECELLHSRLLSEDRKRKEEWLEKRFGKEAMGSKSLLVATQVVEAGLDISADCLLTELAPIDALIQRVGRCVRWGGSGIAQVFDVKSASPYESEFVDKTRDVLKQDLPTCLTWQKSKEWVNEVLNERYERALQDATYDRVVAVLSCAAFTGDRRRAEKAVRDTDTVEVTLHEQPEELGKDVLRLPTISVHIGVVKSWIRQGAKAWRVEVDSQTSDASLQVQVVPVSERQILIGDRVIFSPSKVAYDPECGLEFGRAGKGFEPIPPKEQGKYDVALQKETWIEHAVRTAQWMEELLERHKHAIKGLANMLGVKCDDVRFAAKLAALLHDLGKLNISWQRKAGVNESAEANELLAHTSERNYEHFPTHATVSACALWEVLREKIPCQLGKAALFAIAHHHSARASQVPEYKLHPSWQGAVETAMRQIGIDNFEFDKVNVEQKSSMRLPGKFPPHEQERLYTAYVLLARFLRLADRIATEGSEDAIFRYEDWFGRL